MQVNATHSATYQSIGNTELQTKVKQLFLRLGSALATGDVSAANQAFTELQKYAPNPTEDRAHQINASLAAVGKALQAGDLKSAQAAYAATKTAATRTDSGKAPGAGGPPPGGGNRKAAATSSSSSDAKVYDPADTNKDGTVSSKEKQDYALKHPAATALENDVSPLDALA